MKISLAIFYSLELTLIQLEPSSQFGIGGGTIVNIIGKYFNINAAIINCRFGNVQSVSGKSQIL